MRPTVTLTETISTCFTNLMKDIGTSVPAKVLSFDSSAQLAGIQIAILGVDGQGNDFEQPPILSVPVFFAGSSNYSIQHELNAGDEGIAIFSQRCIDGFVTKGAGNPNPILRFHDISDAMFIPGLRSNPKKINSFNSSGISIAKNDGSQSVTLKSNGDVEITTDGDLVIDGIRFKDHTHEASATMVAGTAPNALPVTGETKGVTTS